MARFTSFTEVVRTVVYETPLPATAAEVDVMMTSIDRAWRRANPGKSICDDSIMFGSDGENLRLYFHLSISLEQVDERVNP
jgi:hypothetical protein